MKKSSARKSLLMSILAMLFSISMFAGTTFAWFTDSVTSSNNRIVAGNLDVEMYYKTAKTGSDYTTVETGTEDPKFFVTPEGGEIKWEPGVKSYANFKVENVGTLALQYKFITSSQHNSYNSKSLEDVIKVAVLNGEVEVNDSTYASVSEWSDFASFAHTNPLLAAGASDKFTVLLYWEPTTNDNNYNLNNGRIANDNLDYLYIDIDIQLVATQITSEADSFDNQYDLDARLYAIDSTGAWKSVTGDPVKTLEGTDSAYFMILGEKGFLEPTKVYSFENATDMLEASANGLTVTGNAITYNRENATTGQEVIICTNSAEYTIEINAPKDVVHHYGSAGSLNIIAVAGRSYHENGKVAFMEVANGRVVLENQSTVSRIHLTKTDDNFNDITIAKAPEVTAFPTFSRDQVSTIPESGKLVVALQEDATVETKDYVWLTEIGVYEQVTVSASNTEAGTVYAADTNNTSKKTAAEQIANNFTFTDENVDYKVKAEKTVTSSGITWDYSVVTDNEAETVVSGYSAAKVATAVAANGDVTVENAVEITKENTETAPTLKVEDGLNLSEKVSSKQEVVEVAQNEEAIEKAEEAGYDITHHEAKAASCTEVGYYAYDSYEVNSEVVKIGYKEIPALGHQKAENATYQTAFSGGKWQHATQCVVDSAWIVEDCVDEDNDNACDVCGHQMYIEVRSTDDLYTDRGFGISNGYYKLMNDVALTKPQYGNVYLNSNVVIDLNGYTLSNYPLNGPTDAQFRSYGTANSTFVFTLKDSSEAKTGQFMSRFGDHFLYGGQNNGNNKLIIICEDGVTINTSYDYQGNEMDSFSYSAGYFVNDVSKDIEIRNAHLIIGGIAHVNSGYTVTFKNCTIESRQSSGFLQSGSGNIVYDACTITTVMQSSSGNVLDSSSYPTVTFTNGTTVNGVAK